VWCFVCDCSRDKHCGNCDCGKGDRTECGKLAQDEEIVDVSLSTWLLVDSVMGLVFMVIFWICVIFSFACQSQVPAWICASIIGLFYFIWSIVGSIVFGFGYDCWEIKSGRSLYIITSLVFLYRVAIPLIICCYCWLSCCCSLLCSRPSKEQESPSSVPPPIPRMTVFPPAMNFQVPPQTNVIEQV